MSEDSTRSRIWNLKIQRWLIPGVIGALGIGYVFWESVQGDGHAITSEESVMGFLLLGLIVPLLAFATLTWVVQGANYWKAANLELESRVAERTLELEHARQQLSEKAEMLSAMLAAERRIEEKTRAGIAADLHDGVQQLIVGALYEIQSTRDTAIQNPASVPLRLSATQDLLRRIEAEMRRAIYSLHPVALDAQGLVPALRECTERFGRRTGITCGFKVDGRSRRLTPEVEVAVFRVAQEALNNVDMHAHARSVQVNLGFGNLALTLRVSDDGLGFDPCAIQKRASAHLGLISMRERVNSVGGTLEIQSQPGQGTIIVLSVPFVHADAPAEFAQVE